MDGGVDSLCHDVASQCSNCDEGEGGREIKIDMAIDVRLVTEFDNSSGAGTRHLEAVNFLSLSLFSLLSLRLSVNGPTNSETIFRTWHHVIADSAPISLCQE